jgi:hypothetical protein
MRRSFLSLLFACLFVLLQSGLAAHAVSHLDDADNSALPGHHCELCVSYSGLGAAPPALPVVTLSNLQHEPARPGRLLYTTSQVHRSAFAARAPPVFS